MREVYLKVPELKDLWFRKKCMEDPDTMSYNAGYDVPYSGYHYDTGCIDFPESKWAKWYTEKIIPKKIFYAYIVDKETGEFVGYTNFRKGEDGKYYMGVLVYSEFRGKGYMKPTLKCLIDEAKKAGVKELWDSVPLNRTSAQKGFKDMGFEVVEIFESTRFNKPDPCAIIRGKID